jgi:hypothetical protein
MRYEYSDNIDRRGTREADEKQHKTLEEIKEEMGEEHYLEILRKFANGEALTEDEQALIDSLKEGHVGHHH